MERAGLATRFTFQKLHVGLKEKAEAVSGQALLGVGTPGWPPGHTGCPTVTELCAAQEACLVLLGAPRTLRGRAATSTAPRSLEKGTRLAGVPWLGGGKPGCNSDPEPSHHLASLDQHAEMGLESSSGATGSVISPCGHCGMCGEKEGQREASGRWTTLLAGSCAG